MRLLPGISYGTEAYPERIARRLRTVNIAAWIAATFAAYFALRRLTDPAGDKLIPGLVNAGAAVCFAALPLLHRFNPLAAPLAFVGIAYAFIFWAVSLDGTGGGSWLGYMIAVPLLVLAFGAERLLLTATLSALAAGLIVVVHLTVPASTGYLSPRTLFYGDFVTNVVVSIALLFSVVHYAAGQIARAEAEAERQYQRSESLLLDILPASIAERLKNPLEPVIADKYEAASVLFADMAGFTAWASKTEPEELVHFLNRVVTALDRLAEEHGLEKIKTTGDAYMVVSGVPVPRADHAAALADFAIAMRDSAVELNDPHGRPVPIRIGIASGPVVAGIVGTKKIFYDVWGDAVNVASRMETTDEAGKIQVSQETYELLRDSFILERRGAVEIKGKGSMVTWLLIGRKTD